MKKTLLPKFKVMACVSFAFACANAISVQAVAAERLSKTTYQVDKQESGTISGKVVDEKGEPLPGATIIIKELKKAVVSTINGTFSVSVPAGTYNVSVTYVSYASLTLNKIVVKAGENVPLNITLKAESGTLNELIIVGYGTQKRANATGAVDQISSKSLENRPITN